MKMFIFVLSFVYMCNDSQDQMVINLRSNKSGQELHYYPFAVKLDRCIGSCNSLNDLSNKVCVSNKTGDLNLSVFNMMTGINKSKTLTKHM